MGVGGADERVTREGRGGSEVNAAVLDVAAHDEGIVGGEREGRQVDGGEVEHTEAVRLDAVADGAER